MARIGQRQNNGKRIMINEDLMEKATHLWRLPRHSKTIIAQSLQDVRDETEDQYGHECNKLAFELEKERQLADDLAVKLVLMNEWSKAVRKQFPIIPLPHGADKNELDILRKKHRKEREMNMYDECIEGQQHVVWETSDSWDNPHMNTYVCEKCGEVIMQPEDLGSGG